MGASDSVVVGERGVVVVNGSLKVNQNQTQTKHASLLHAFTHVTSLHHGLDHR